MNYGLLWRASAMVTPPGGSKGLQRFGTCWPPFLPTAATTNAFSATPWAELLATVTVTMTANLAYSTRPLVWWLAEHFATLSTSEQVSVGIVARRIRIFALETNDQNLLSPAVTMTAKTAAGTPNESIATLRRCISPELTGPRRAPHSRRRSPPPSWCFCLSIRISSAKSTSLRVRLSRDKHGRYFKLALTAKCCPCGATAARTTRGVCGCYRSISRGSCEFRRATRSALWLQSSTTSLRSNTTHRWSNCLSKCGSGTNSLHCARTAA